MISIEIQAIKVNQPIGSFYIGKMKASELVSITYPDMREMKKENDLNSYLGIQRELNKKRAEEIRQYVKTFGATFPNSIILSIDDEHCTWKEEKGLFVIESENPNKIARILDGQHRVAGFMNKEATALDEDQCRFITPDGYQDFELVVTFFVGLDLPDQASIFSIVNLKQTPVRKSLVYDLEALSNTRSPQKSAHTIVVSLNKNNKSPFYNRIKRLGIKTPDIENEKLSQSTVVEEIMKLMSPDPLADREYFLKKSKSGLFSKSIKLENTDKDSFKKYPLRELFINERDDDIAKMLWSYFDSVKASWPEQWDKNNKKAILNKTVGFYALMHFFSDLVAKMPPTEDIRDYFQKSIKKVTFQKSDFDTNMEPSSKTTSRLYGIMKSSLS
ncbi:DGQHR domain-containing protein [Neptunomonas japonica]|uniref:DGQHR domain-containing protein n=1 Tax=Neptunomonas japonica JAMM 1380 TaxID=1441457 RepID=A0A7R6PVS7_9GAMM|nr:DGQHR domain-containing protein [Neptunomonas japonica]BBB31490.1 conserved hypothetical protein [Neptunomonas japonica JAMM 1380]